MGKVSEESYRCEAEELYHYLHTGRLHRPIAALYVICIYAVPAHDASMDG